MLDKNTERPRNLLYISSALVVGLAVFAVYQSSNSGTSSSPLPQDLPEITDIQSNDDGKTTSLPLTGSSLDPETQAQLLALLPDSAQPNTMNEAITLWHASPEPDSEDSQELRTERVVADISQLHTIAVGTDIEFFIPHTNTTHNALVSSQKTSDSGLEIFKIEFENNNGLTGGQIVLGARSTDAVIITDAGHYTVSINNQTGLGTVIDDRDLHIYRNKSDQIIVPTSLPPEPDTVF